MSQPAIDILYREDMADLLKLEVQDHFGDDFEAVIRDVLLCYNRKNIVIMVYLCSKPWRSSKKGHGACFRYGLTKLQVPEIRIALHNRYQMLLTLFHELEHLGRPPTPCFSKEQHKIEEQLVERRAKSMYLQYLVRQSAFQEEAKDDTTSN